MTDVGLQLRAKYFARLGNNVTIVFGSPTSDPTCQEGPHTQKPDLWVHIFKNGLPARTASHHKIYLWESDWLMEQPVCVYLDD